MSKWNKCNFCQRYDSFDGCTAWSCEDDFKFSPESLIEAAKEEGVSVADVIKLIEYCGD